MRAYSYSQMRQFADCRLAWKLAKIDKVPEEKSLPMLVGGACHSAIEAYSEACWRSRLPSDAAIIPEIVAGIRGDDKKPVSAEIRTEVVALMEKFAGSFAVIGSELQFEGQMAFTPDWSPAEWFGKDVRFRAIADLMDFDRAGEKVSVTDFKTGWKIDPSSEVEDNLQLRIYALAAALKAPWASEFRVRLWHVRFAYEQGPFVIHRDEIDGIRAEVEERMAEMDAETEFAASPGEHCQRCGFRRSCPAYKASGRTEEIPEDSRELAAAFAFAKARVKVLEEAVKARVSVAPIELGNGKVLTFVGEQKTEVVQLEPLVRALLNVGVTKGDVWSEMSLSKTAVEKLLRKVGRKEMAADLLRQYGEVSTVTKLKEREA